MEVRRRTGAQLPAHPLSQEAGKLTLSRSCPFFPGQMHKANELCILRGIAGWLSASLSTHQQRDSPGQGQAAKTGQSTQEENTETKLFATAHRQSSHSAGIILASQREGLGSPTSVCINRAELFYFNVAQEAGALTLPILHSATYNFPCDHQVNVEYQAHLRIQLYRDQKVLKHISLHSLESYVIPKDWPC